MIEPLTMANATVTSGLPPLPEYTLSQIPDLLPFISDFWLSILLPHICYWILSMIFHVIDIYDLLPQYRLHTPEEITARNRVTRFEVARDVLLEQAMHIVMGAVLDMSEPPQMVGREDYDVAVWATRIRLAQRALPALLGVLGLNAATISKNMALSHPVLAGALAGGQYPFLTSELNGAAAAPAFATWELTLAKTIYWLLLPAFQFFVGVVAIDAWQYFMHRMLHVNKWMYNAFHARHHRLYVPYAYGALYNHPVEAISDALGAGIAYKVSFLSPRMGMWLFVFSNIKTVDDHSGYALPWDPLQHLSSNNAAYHDIHHQAWGIKTNFSQPFFTFWDRLLGTVWQGDTAAKYARARETLEARNKAQAKAKAQ